MKTYNNREEAKIDLEDILDFLGNAGVADALAEICEEKADHIQSSYDDRTLANSWRGDAKRWARVSEKLGV